MEETIAELLALDGHSLRVSRIAADTVRVQVVDAVDPAALELDLAIDVRLEPDHRWYRFTTRLRERDGSSISERVFPGRFRYRVAGVRINLDGVHGYEFDTDLVFDLLEQRLRAREWRPRPGFWSRLRSGCGARDGLDRR
ncbi:MAG: hypothetical protein QM804_17395 [Propionicimonas sp.]